MISAPRQKNLVLPGEVTRCALLDIGGVRSKLPGNDEDSVLALIEMDMVLPWAWNIGVGSLREIRVLPSCVEHYAKTAKRIKIQWREVLEEIFTGITKPYLTGKDARLILNCGSDTITRHLKAGELKPWAGTTWSRGRNGSALISSESFVAFLAKPDRFVVPPEEML